MHDRQWTLCAAGRGDPRRIAELYRISSDGVADYCRVLQEDHSYCICGMAVDPGHRRKGIGAALLAKAESACRRLGLDKLSLIVFDQNVDAKRLYERSGFVVRRSHPVVARPLIHYTGDALLMVRQLAAAA